MSWARKMRYHPEKPYKIHSNSALDNDISIDTIIKMSKIEDILTQMRQSPKNVRFKDLSLVCDHCFGEARQKGSSHRVYKTLWPGDPRVNIQSNKGKAKAYQVKQVLMAVERLEMNHDTEK